MSYNIYSCTKHSLPPDLPPYYYSHNSQLKLLQSRGLVNQHPSSSPAKPKAYCSTSSTRLRRSASPAPTKPHTPSDLLPRITVMCGPASHYSHSIGRVFQLAYGTTRLLSPATPTQPGFSHMNQDYASPYSLPLTVQYWCHFTSKCPTTNLRGNASSGGV